MRRFYSFLGLLAIAGMAMAQPVVNGDLSDADYVVIGNKLNSNAGFGGSIDVSQILYYPDDAAGILYLGFEGRLNTGSNDGLGSDQCSRCRISRRLGCRQQPGFGGGGTSSIKPLCRFQRSGLWICIQSRILGYRCVLGCSKIYRWRRSRIPG